MTRIAAIVAAVVVGGSILSAQSAGYWKTAFVSTSAPVGYSAGAGGTVTQATNKTTGVTLSKPSGQITMSAAALAAGVEACFTVTNTAVDATDTVVIAHRSGGTAGAYMAYVGAVGAGSFVACVSNVTAGSLSEAAVLNFAVVKGASS